MTTSASIPSQAASVEIASRYCSAVAVAIMSTGFPSDASGGRNAPKRSWICAGRGGTSSPNDSQASAHMIPGPPALVSTATRRPLWERLVGKHRRHVEHLREAVGADHPCLLEESVHGHVGGRQQRPGVGAGRPGPRRRAPALHHDDRLLPADSGGHPREPPRIAERLDVEQRHVGAGVRLPVLEQVVGGDVGAISHRRERGQAQVAIAGELDERQSERPALRDEADVSRLRHARGEGRIQPHAGGGVDDAEAVGSDQSHTALAADLEQLALKLGSLRSAPRRTRPRSRPQPGSPGRRTPGRRRSRPPRERRSPRGRSVPESHRRCGRPARTARHRLPGSPDRRCLRSHHEEGCGRSGRQPSPSPGMHR